MGSGSAVDKAIPKGYFYFFFLAIPSQTHTHTHARTIPNLVSPFDGQFTMNSLRALEEVAGINILTALGEHQKRLVDGAGIDLSYDLNKKLEVNAVDIEIIMNKWVSGKGKQLSPTWNGLMIMLSSMNLRHLTAQIENYFGKTFLQYYKIFNSSIFTR